MQYRWVKTLPLNSQYDVLGRVFKGNRLILGELSWCKKDMCMFMNMLCICSFSFSTVKNTGSNSACWSMEKRFFTRRKLIGEWNAKSAGCISWDTANSALRFVSASTYTTTANYLIVFPVLELSLLTSLQWKKGKGLLWLWVFSSLATVRDWWHFSETGLRSSGLHFLLQFSYIS